MCISFDAYKRKREIIIPLEKTYEIGKYFMRIPRGLYQNRQVAYTRVFFLVFSSYIASSAKRSKLSMSSAF